MAGQRLGPKNTYLYYTDDIDVAYLIKRDATLALAGLGDDAAAPEVYDAENPPTGIIITPKPQGFQPRVVFIQSTTDGARKEMIAFHPNSALYLKNFSDAFPEIDGDATFVSTGRKGEKLSFG
jgi:hypothetical protein